MFLNVSRAIKAVSSFDKEQILGGDYLKDKFLIWPILSGPPSSCQWQSSTSQPLPEKLLFTIDSNTEATSGQCAEDKTAVVQS